jgi:hypothetical protein
MFNYAIGFDADTKRCGLVLADLNEKVILETYNEDILDITIDILPDLLNRYQTKTNRMFARIEIPTFQTAVSVNMHKKSRFDFAQGVFDSARCAEVAIIFKKRCVQLGITHSSVKSSNRVRCNYGHAKQFTIDQLKRYAADKHKKGKFLTKVNSQKAMQLFTSMKIVNSETVDAALLIPEIL